MRVFLVLCFVLFFGVLAAQEEASFSLLRQNDKIKVDSEEGSNSFYDDLKYTPIFADGFVSFGGSFRGQYEYFKNEEFSFSPNEENGWYLQRLLVHSDLHINPNLKVFAELGSSLIFGKEELAPVDLDEIYVNQFFVEYETEKFGIRIGRENLQLGSRRLLDPREGPNVRRSFNHASVTLNKENKEFLIFAGNPVVPESGIFDNISFDNEEWLWGFYASGLYSGTFILDAYYLGSHYGTATYEIGTDEEVRHSLGVRTWRQKGKWIFDNEAVLQIGSFGEQNIWAWTVSFNVSNQLNSRNRIGVKSELITGSRNDEFLGTFNALYPRGAYFGRVARFGPANLIDMHPYWSYRKDKLTFEIDYDVFWRFSTEDAVYGPALNIVIDGESDERFIGHQIGTITNYEFNRFAMIELETNIIFPGMFIEDALPGANVLFHTVLTTELRF